MPQVAGLLFGPPLGGASDGGDRRSVGGEGVGGGCRHRIAARAGIPAGHGAGLAAPVYCRDGGVQGSFHDEGVSARCFAAPDRLGRFGVG
jgi:hypothetical protein